MSTVDYTCVCGKQMRFKSEHAGKKTKCPDCSATITVPSEEEDDVEDYQEDEDDEADNDSNQRRSGTAVYRVTGRRAVASFGGQVVPSMFGQTTLELSGGRLIETTHGILSRRHAELLLTEVDSAEFRIQPNPALLGAGLALLPVFGIGLLVLPFYFFIKYKYLVIHSGSNATIVAITGSEHPFQDFMDTVLNFAEKAKRQHLT